MSNHDSQTERITDLMHRAAKRAAPEPLDLWPQIAAEIDSRRAPRPQPDSAPRRRIALAALPALLIIVLLGVVVLATRGSDGTGVRFASLNDPGTPTVSPDESQNVSNTATPGAPILYATPASDPASTDLVASGIVDRFHLREEPSDDASAIVVLRGENNTVYDRLNVLGQREVNGELWYQVQVVTQGGNRTGWVEAEYIRVYTDPASDLVASGIVDRFHLREQPSDDAPAIALLRSGFNGMAVLDQREVNGETWYQVRVIVTSGVEVGWVKETYVRVSGYAPTAQPIANLEARYTTYYSPALDLTFDAPADWLPYEDPALNPADQDVAAISFYADPRDLRPLTEGAPEYGPALVLLRLPQNADGEFPFEATHALLGSLLGEDVLQSILTRPPPEMVGALQFGSFIGQGEDHDNAFFMLIAPPHQSATTYQDTFDHVLKSAGIRLFDSVTVREEDFTDGVYTVRGTLDLEDPTRFYVLEAVNMPQEMLAGDGWTLVQVDGDYRTPELRVEYASADYSEYTRYTSTAGAILFPLPTAAADRAARFLHLNVNGFNSYLFGDYTFTLRPVTDPVPVGPEPTEIAVKQGAPVVLRFDLPDDQLARLRIDTVQAMSMDEALQSRILPEPEIAVLFPYGETLTHFRPRRSEALQIDFMPPMQGQQFIVLNPLDLCLPEMSPEDCAEYTLSVISLRVSIEPVSAPTAITFGGDLHIDGDKVTLGTCTATVQDGTAPDRFPLDSYTVIEQTADHATLAAEFGAPVHAAGAGTVIYAGWQDQGYGSTIVIAHGDTYTVYAHVGIMYVQCGEYVEAGERIASVGETGNVPGSVLRFEVRDAAFDLLDPAVWMAF